MQSLFDQLSFQLSRRVTHAYSTSFSTAVRLLSPQVRKAIHAIYGFVRFADEIVDSFHGHNQATLLDRFEMEYRFALEEGMSLNPIIHSFQQTVKEYNIPSHLVDSFLQSMKMDLEAQDYSDRSLFEKYIYGSADVVGLMCLQVFVNGDSKKYEELKESAMKLGSAFQKVNFLRDLKADTEGLARSYFPNVDFNALSPENKLEIIQEIELDFKGALAGIVKLPKSSKFGVYTAYVYYSQLLKKLKKTPAEEILEQRIRVQNHRKISLLFRSYVDVKLGLVS